MAWLGPQNVEGLKQLINSMKKTTLAE